MLAVWRPQAVAALRKTLSEGTRRVHVHMHFKFHNFVGPRYTKTEAVCAPTRLHLGFRSLAYVFSEMLLPRCRLVRTSSA